MCALLSETSYRIRVLAVSPPRKKMGTRLKIFIAPKNFCGFRLVNEKTRLKLAHFLRRGGQQVHDYNKLPGKSNLLCIFVLFFQNIRFEESPKKFEQKIWWRFSFQQQNAASKANLLH